ncbi:lysophospholipase [Amylostereum chailletii]|nr:lysophospholipase [Amylostereum chailletii]
MSQPPASPLPLPYTEAWLSGHHNLPPVTLYTRTYTPPGQPKGALIFIHGFCEHVARYAEAHQIWASRGFIVFAFDQRGFGRTSLEVDGRQRKAVGGEQVTYGQTGQEEQMGDVEWAVGHVKEIWPGVPIFLMGRSMGGGIVLNYVSRVLSFPEDVRTDHIRKSLSGVIASSPLLRLTHPPLGPVRWAGGKAGQMFPNLTIPAGVDPKHLSHDPAAVEENRRDRLCRSSATVRAVDTMLTRGENLLTEPDTMQYWPVDLPVLILHGDSDEVTSAQASREFIENLNAKDKHLSIYPGGYHELHHEPDGVKERFVDECISWVEARLPAVRDN